MVCLYQKRWQGATELHIGEKKRVISVPVDQIRPNPAQPRKSFEEKPLAELARSIQTNGLIQPLVVRQAENGKYELIAGERRLRACIIAGMKSVPCIVSSCSSGESAVMAMAENMQRRDLGIFEEAEGIKHLIDVWNVTQEEAARRLGKSQSSIANKMRLLRFTDEERKRIIESGLTERHARALLRIQNLHMRRCALETIITRQYNVCKAEEYVEKLISGNGPEKQRKKPVIKDVRIFLNTISHAVQTMEQCGISAQTLKSETDDYLECIIRIPKSQATAGGRKPA
jgi:ParB family chromosome partitioning protein